MTEPLLRVDDLTVRFGELAAVDRVSLSVAPASIVGVVGESGSGKTTLARVVAGQLPPSTAITGTASLDGAVLPATRSKAQRLAIQMIFQDPYSSLNPRRTVRKTLTELLRVHHLREGAGVIERSEELMDLVRLPHAALDQFPGQFSGGQRQRIAIARALAVEPRLLVADEPTSALDVSVQTTVLDLFADLRESLGLSIVFISHDLAVVNRLCDRVAVMRSGRIVEEAATADLFRSPQHEYSRQLLAAAPRLARSGSSDGDPARSADPTHTTADSVDPSRKNDS
jgi:oligopeptide transport system ATP-binding protein